MLNCLGHDHTENIPSEAFFLTCVPTIDERAHYCRSQLFFSFDQVANRLTLRRMRIHLKKTPQTLSLKECRIKGEAGGDADQRLAGPVWRLPEAERLTKRIRGITP